MNMINRLREWMSDPFGKEKIRKHTQVLDDMQRAIVMTHETKTTILNVPANKFPIGHMIGDIKVNKATHHSRRA